MIVTFMAFNRLKSIWRIGIYNKGNNRFVSFKRTPKRQKSLPSIVLSQVVCAFVFSFFVHMPFFLENSSDRIGTCGFHEHGNKCKVFIVSLLKNELVDCLFHHSMLYGNIHNWQISQSYIGC